METFHKYIFLGKPNNQFSYFHDIFMPMMDECTIGLDLAISFKNIGHIE